jgi:hypothetical protein
MGGENQSKNDAGGRETEASLEWFNDGSSRASWDESLAASAQVDA